jgi:hypothetical protein
VSALRRLPAAFWVVWVLALLNGSAWALLTPSFQVIDEFAHTSYAQFLVERGALPKAGTWEYAPDMQQVQWRVPFGFEGWPSWSPANDRLAQRVIPRAGGTTDLDTAGAGNYPPLYYAYEAIPYAVVKAAGGDLLDRLLAMRLWSVLLGSLAVPFVFLFLRELLPRAPWAWATGAGVVALQPVYAGIIGGVNNDAPAYAAGAALLWLLARAFRRGLSTQIALGIAAAMAAGILSKPSFYGLLPGLAVALALLAARLWRAGDRRAALGRAGAALGLPLLAYGLWLAVAAVLVGSDTGATAAGGLASSSVERAVSLREGLAYVWQFYLPKLPFMTDQFTVYPTRPLWDSYVSAFIGRWGWFQYGFTPAFNRGAAVVLAIVVLLAAWALARRPDVVRRRAAEIVAYGALLVGLALAVNVAGYRVRALGTQSFEQVRYLFPLLGLYGALVAAATLAVRRRWSPVLGALLTGIATGHALYALVTTFNRYYI